MGLTIWLGIWVTPPTRSREISLDFSTFIPRLPRWRSTSPSDPTIASAFTSGDAPIDGHGPCAHCAMEVSLVFIVLTLITGSIWGRPAWGVWWAWDARLTLRRSSCARAGYLALRRANDDAELRARRSAVLRDTRGDQRADRPLLRPVVAHVASGLRPCSTEP